MIIHKYIIAPIITFESNTEFKEKDIAFNACTAVSPPSFKSNNTQMRYPFKCEESDFQVRAI